ncbi:MULTISPECIES: hypothetical protein [Bacillaceae]|uniref:Uncharacterized protein n=1 Tax=Gottfriedia acidiceleris TaxID=371036 RepID=A0ABY4JNF7_9BACI|nr:MULTISPECIES: hypothetical protein [Bacillaceae]UPM53855.1 hypothetical protein MY490_19080 [Gottfriedia acidiceleris]
MSKFDKISLYIFGIALISGLYYIGFQIHNLQEDLDNIRGQLWNIFQLLNSK